MAATRVLAGFVTVLVLNVSLSAHHSAAVYGNSTLVLKDVTVSSLIWSNPHSIILFTAKDPKGKNVSWSAESGPPSTLTRIGWNRNSLKAGDVVTIELYPAKNGASVGRLAKVTFHDGRQLMDSQNRNIVTQ